MQVSDKMENSPRDEFIEMMVEIQRAKGLDELSSKLIGIMFIEPNEITLNELSEITGYSLSAISTSMKFLERTGLVKRFKKPGSRKLYFYMGKDMPSMLTEIVKKLEKNVSMLKSRIPGIRFSPPFAALRSDSSVSLTRLRLRSFFTVLSRSI